MTEHTEDVLKALRDELAGVSPSPEFQSRVRQRIAGELDLLREQLAAVEPSPEFKVRVRQQIEAAGEARRASWLSGWRWVVPASALAAVLLLAVVLSRPGAPTPAPVAVTAHSEAPSTGAAGRGTSDPGRRTPDPGRGTPGAGLAVPHRAAPSSEPSLEVITNQPALLRAMWARASAGQSVVASADAPLPEEARDVVVAPIEVNPVVVKWMVEPPVTSGMLPFIRRVAADMAERSAK